MKTYLLAALLLFHCPLTGQTLDSILAQHLTARGGAALEQLKTVEISFNMSSRSQPGLKAQGCKIYRERREAFRAEINSTMMGFDMKTIDCTSPRGIWLSFNKMTKEEKIEGDKVNRRIRMFEVSSIGDVYGLFHHAASRGFLVTLLGTDTIKSTPVFTVQVSIPADTLSVISYLRQSDGVEIQRTIVEEGRPPMNVYFSDFRQVEGLLLPFYTETHNNAGSTVYEYTDVLLNKALPADLFDKPGQEPANSPKKGQ